MFVAFFHGLKTAGVPVTLREYLTLMEAMEKDLAGRRVEDFYYLARTALVKDERNLDMFMRPERHNAVKVLLFFDVGGSMDWHVKATEELFSAARSEFKHMEHFYFHNCLYEKVWKQNRRRFEDTTPTWDVLHTYPHDYKVIFVGDASMSPYEITAPGGSVEHFNEEAGALWLERVTRTYPACVWLIPVAEKDWDYTQSIRIMRQVMGGRMYPLTLEGLDKSMRELVR